MLPDHSWLKVNAKGKSWKHKVILWQKRGPNFELMTWFFQIWRSMHTDSTCTLFMNNFEGAVLLRYYICLLKMESTKSAETDTYLNSLLPAVISEFLQKYLLSCHSHLSFVATIWTWNVLNEYAKLHIIISTKEKNILIQVLIEHTVLDKTYANNIVIKSLGNFYQVAMTNIKPFWLFEPNAKG